MKTIRLLLQACGRHLAVSSGMCGVLVLVVAMGCDRLNLAKSALVLFVVSALSTVAEYWIREPAGELTPSDDTGDGPTGRMARYEEAHFVSVSLAFTLGTISLIWLVTYSSGDLPWDVAWFALVEATFTVTSLLWVTHLARRLRDHQSRERPPQPTHAISRHAF